MKLRQNARKMIFLLVICAFALFIGACAPNEKPEGQQEQKEQQEQGGNNEKVNVISTVVEQWEKSAHAKAVEEDKPEEAPGLRKEGDCFFCHNGYAFETNAKNPEGIGILKGASCDTCHTGHGRTLMKEGTAELPIGTIKGGTGTLCSACHMGRGKKPDQKSAPHYSTQADMFYGESGAEAEGFNYGRSPHQNVKNSCLACHMTEGDNGVSDHRFKMNEKNAGNACGECHDFTNFNPKARGDYDGDGKNEGIRDEVAGLLSTLENEINNKLNGGKFVSAEGRIKFQDKAGNDLGTPPDEEVYNAAWNYLFVKNDGSGGIHNPVYTIQLLQQSYKQLTGNDVPKAEIR